MKSIKSNSTILLFNLIFIMSIGFSACNSDDETVVPKTLEQYKYELSDLVNSEIIVVQNTTKGYNKGEIYTSDSLFDVLTSDYMDSLLMAEEVLAKPDLTITDIINANFALTGPGDAFNSRVFISDRRPLHELIVECDTLRANTPVGNFFGQCPPEQDSLFGVAIANAVYWRNLSTTLDRQVAVEVDSLNDELIIYEAAIIK